MRTTLITPVLLSAVLLTLAAGGAPVEDQEQFFLRGEGCGATEDPYLSTMSGDDGLDGCGGIGGLPFNEIFNAAGVDVSTDFTTRDGVPVVVDATRNLTGQVQAEQWVGNTVSAGQVVVEVEISGLQEGSSVRVTLGTFTDEAIVTPLDGDGIVFEFDLDIPDNVSTTPFRQLTVNVVVRGVNQNNSNLGLSGDSYIDLPILVEEEV